MPGRYPPAAPCAALAVFAGALLTYVLTLAPGLAHGHDTGELTVAAATLGIPHPPGYPLYTRLGWLWLQLCPGPAEVAWKMNLFSAICVASAAAALAWLLTRITRDGVAGWCGGMLFAWARSPWEQAVAAEVFSLHLAMLASLAVVAQLWSESESLGRRRAFVVIGALFGLGAAHHHTLVLAAPALLLFARLSAGSWRGWGWSIWVGVALVLTSLPFYVDLMMRARTHPRLNWGSPTTPEKVLHHFLRRAYGTFRLSAQPGPQGSGSAHAIGYVVSVLRRQFPLPLIALAVGALWFPPPRLRPIVVLGAGWAICYGPLFSWLGGQSPDEFHLDMQERFYASSYWGLALLCGLGAQQVRQRWSRLAPLLVVAPLLSLVTNWSACNQAGQLQAYDTMRAQFEQCPPGSLLIVGGDLPAGAADYLQIVEQQRPDLVVVLPGLIGVEWFRERLAPDWQKAAGLGNGNHNQTLLALARFAHSQKRAVFTNQTLAMAGALVQRGLLWQWYPSKDEIPTDASEMVRARSSVRQMRQAGLRGERRLDRIHNFWMSYHLGLWAQGYDALARQLYQADAQSALWALEGALEIRAASASDEFNRGQLLAALGRSREAETAYRAALERDENFVYAAAALVDLLRAQGRTNEASRLEARVRQLRPQLKPGGPATPSK